MVGSKRAMNPFEINIINHKKEIDRAKYRTSNPPLVLKSCMRARLGVHQVSWKMELSKVGGRGRESIQLAEYYPVEVNPSRTQQESAWRALNALLFPAVSRRYGLQQAKKRPPDCCKEVYVHGHGSIYAVGTD